MPVSLNCLSSLRDWMWLYHSQTLSTERYLKIKDSS